MFSLSYCGYRHLLVPRIIIPLWIIPVVTFFLTVTNEMHHLVWTAVVPGSDVFGVTATYVRGIVFWINMGFAYACIFSSGFCLLQVAVRSYQVFRAQAICLAIAVFLPWIGSMFYILRIFPGMIDLTPSAFALSEVFLGIGIFHLQILDIEPIVRDTVFSNIQDAVIVLDMRNRIVDLNQSAKLFFGIGDEVLSANVQTALAAFPEVCSLVASSSNEAQDSVIQHFGAAILWLNVHISIVSDQKGRTVGKLVLCRDTTRWKKMTDEREKLLAELQTALANVKTLSGLLPICMHCKKIRNDEGYWQQVDTYIVENTDATLTHGVCPDCMKNLYPDLESKKS
jgi:hypothetical protein